MASVEHLGEINTVCESTVELSALIKTKVFASMCTTRLPSASPPTLCTSMLLGT